MPALFALTLRGFGNLQMALFAGFGSFATLVLVGFAGTWRNKLIAHLGLALAGSVLLTIGTAVASTAVLAVMVTVPVTFAVFFAGVAAPNAASAVNGALLAYVLPAASPGTVSMIPDRLAGWWLASVAGTIAVLAIHTPATGSAVREAAAKLAQALGDVLESAARGAGAEPLLIDAVEAKHDLLATFAATPFRPTGLSIGDQGLASAVELLEWCTSLVADTIREQPDLASAPASERDLLAASGSALRRTGGLLTDRTTPPDLDGLDALRKQSIDRSRHGMREADPRVAFHAGTIATAVLAVGAATLLAAQLADPGEIAEARTRWFDEAQLGRTGRLAGVSRASALAARHASVRSVWFVNSLRGSLALAAAVAVADATSVQHGFWVGLGTLSVLRTNASATGATALRALAGTVLGFVVGGALLIGIGTSTAALWVALPVAVLIAAYAPGTTPFIVGQAAFTVTVAVLFNLLVPVGWKVGELRVEDVAIGCVVSVLVGMLFWPRGVASVVGDDLADSYRVGASYLREAIAWVCGYTSQEPTSGSAALAAAQRLDEGVRGFLAEQGTKHLPRDALWRLIGGTLRLRLTAHSIAGMPPACAADPGALDQVSARTDALVTWYEELAAQVGRPSRAPSGLSKPRFEGNADAPSRRAVWLREHLDHLAEHLEELIEPAARVAETRRRPWWR